MQLPGGVKAVVSGAKALRAAANNFDEAGKCANMLTKLWNSGCFVPGTVVTLSEMPRGAALQDRLWSDDGLAGAALGADFDWVGGMDSDRGGTATALVDAPARSSTLLQIPIEEVPLGARVPTKNPKPWEYDDSLPEPDEATWAKLSITVQREDGGSVPSTLLGNLAGIHAFPRGPVARPHKQCPQGITRLRYTTRVQDNSLGRII